ncbi:multidrug resistance protein, MATE family [Rhizobium sp. RU20A]|uniref:MATE family efflux transporter n=1 Tax=Rhizobium sp. RU20A TaxID=1907412 RepID=UPI0009543DA9|nr:MATE family efflux transporter [Rhizobium sp. RU20A]SIR32036.1 multidrug resistance protein, MATE family [Rhizobium sp. RU20A]
MQQAGGEQAERIDNGLAAALPVTDTAPSGLFRQAAPMIISRAGIAGMAIVDALMVARLGSSELAATTLSDGTFGRLVDIGISGLHAALVLTAAARLPEQAAARLAVWQRASLVALCAGLVVFALAPFAGLLLAGIGQEPSLSARAGTVILILAAGLPAGLIALAAAVHLEGIGKAGLVARWMIAANLANAGLNALLIGGFDPLPALGAAGSATATTMVRIGLAIALVAAVRRMEGPGAFRPAQITDPVQAAGNRRDHLKLSFGAVSTSAGMHALGVWLTVFAGWLGTAPLAAFASCWVLNLPGLLLAAGIGDAISMRAAAADGPSARLWRDLGRLAFVLAPISAVIVLFAGPIAAHYTPDAALSALLAMLLPVTGVVLFLDGMSYGVFAALRARKDVALPTLIQVGCMVATVLLAGVLAFRLDHGVSGLVEGIIATSLLRLGLLLARLFVVFRPLRLSEPQTA